MKANELQDSRWIVRPEFPWRRECNCQNSVEQNHILQEDDPEVKVSVTMPMLSSNESKSTLDERVEWFSSCYCLQ